jgi:hypothetical protein
VTGKSAQAMDPKLTCLEDEQFPENEEAQKLSTAHSKDLPVENP